MPDGAQPEVLGRTSTAISAARAMRIGRHAAIARRGRAIAAPAAIPAKMPAQRLQSGMTTPSSAMDRSGIRWHIGAKTRSSAAPSSPSGARLRARGRHQGRAPRRTSAQRTIDSSEGRSAGLDSPGACGSAPAPTAASACGSAPARTAGT
nr:hypothetical protein [Sorangium cellulosum]